ncbi:MAG: cytochrome-c peroxidase [Mariprofundaceae bacterium]|nr:cytochrome-c peroxidase [Mariprofundaceae bacterium]
MENSSGIRIILSTLLLAGLIWLLWEAGSAASTPKQHAEASAPPAINEPLLPLSVPAGLDAEKVALGEKLFHEPRLSADNSISCAHCHSLDRAGVDGLPRSFGINGEEGEINTPTVFNSGLHIAQFWDGRAVTLEDQIDGPVHNPKEMGSGWPQIIRKLEADPGYVSAFSRLYPDGMSSENIKGAIATFERSLVTTSAPFDRYLRGEEEAISAGAKKGYRLFRSYGCVACHQGANVGGNMFQTFGIMGDYFADRGNITRADLGRYNVTGLEEDRHLFRVPSLRLVTLTAPYFHDGSARTLHDAIEVMARYQLGRKIGDEDKQLIVEFLQTLVGEYRGRRPGP